MSESILNRSINWRKTTGAVYIYQSEVNGQSLLIRLGDFPDEPMYTLSVDGVDVAEFDDWPARWMKSS